MVKQNRKLTKQTIDGLRADPSGKDVIYFDVEIPRFGVRVKPSGAKSYVLQYRNKFGQGRRTTIGRVGDLTPAQARKRALALRGEIAGGADPSAQKRADRNAVTVGDLCDEYLEAAKGRMKESTREADRNRIDCHIRPLLGANVVASLTPADMEKFYRDVSEGKSAPKDPEKVWQSRKNRRGGVAKGGAGVAKRSLDTLRAALQRAVRDGVIASNPARGVIPDRKPPPKPAFSFEDVAALGAAMRQKEAEGENLIGLRAIRFLLLTGCRRTEALALQWSTVDRRARCLRFPDTKSGPQTRPMGRAALELLLSFEPPGAKPTDYVFPSTVAGLHLVGLPKIWERVAKRAGIVGVSLHGLRHWFASAAAEMNFSELTIAGLLGHTVKGVTARYATTPDSALLAAADRVSLRLADALNGVEGRKVISLVG